MPIENIFFMVALILGVLAIGRYFESGKTVVSAEINADIERIYMQLQGKVEDYTFYGGGHALVWSETSRAEFESALLLSSKIYQPGFWFSFYRKPEFAYHVDEHYKDIFYAIGKSNFDFKSKKIYLGDGKCREIHS